MYDEQLLKTIILFQVCFLAYPLQAPIWLYVQKFEWLLLSVCTIPGIGLKVCQPFSIISPNPPPSQFATFPFAGSGRRDQEPHHSLPQSPSLLLIRAQFLWFWDIPKQANLFSLCNKTSIFLPTLSSPVDRQVFASNDWWSFPSKMFTYCNAPSVLYLHSVLLLPLRRMERPPSVSLFSFPLTPETFFDSFHSRSSPPPSTLKHLLILVPPSSSLSTSVLWPSLLKLRLIRAFCPI